MPSDRQVMNDKLFAAAREAMEMSYSPYSKFPVGAAILTKSGNIYAGCNIENASYPQGWCAEPSAISRMIGSGEREIAEVCVVAKRKDRATPCGGCRQKLSEFSDANTLVHLCDKNGVAETWTLADMLPASFDLEA